MPTNTETGEYESYPREFYTTEEFNDSYRVGGFPPPGSQRFQADTRIAGGRPAFVSQFNPKQSTFLGDSSSADPSKVPGYVPNPDQQRRFNSVG